MYKERTTYLSTNVTISKVIATRKAHTLTRPTLDVRYTDYSLNYNAITSSLYAIDLYKAPNLSLITIRNITVLPTNFGTAFLPKITTTQFSTSNYLSNWGINPKPEVTVQEFRDYLNSLNKFQRSNENDNLSMTDSSISEIALINKYPNLAGLREIDTKNDLILKEALSKISRLDNYFYIAIGIYKIISSSTKTEFDKQMELEKFTFQAHTNQLKTDDSLNFTNDTARYIVEKQDFITKRLDFIQEQIKNNKELDVDVNEVLSLFNLIFDKLTTKELANSLLNWSIDLYKQEFMSDSVDSLKSTRLHFELGRLFYKKALNAGKQKFDQDWMNKQGSTLGEYPTFTQYLASLDPIHTKIYDKVIDGSINYDQLTSVLGNIIIDILRRARILDQNKSKTSKKEFYHLNTTKQFKNKLGVVNMTAAKIPTTFPMVHAPKLWDIDDSGNISRYGGYLWNDNFGRSDMWYHKELYSNDTKLIVDENKSNALIKLINGLSRTPFRINKELLNFIIDHNHELNIFTPYDSSIKDVPRTRANKDQIKMKDKARLDFTTIILGLVYSHADKFFLPVKADFRTRIYSDVYALSYQGGDIARSIIEFYKPGELNKTSAFGITMFKSMGASLYSKVLGKASIVDRVKWVEENKHILSDIKNNIEFIKNSNPSKRSSFVAWCLEYTKFLEWENSDRAASFHTHFPIQLDATCSGLQHLVMLIRDYDNMNLLNLSSKNLNEVPADFYGYTVNSIALMMSNSLAKDDSNLTEEELSVRESYKRLLAFGINRGHVKSALMTSNYNARKPTMAEYIETELGKTCIVTKYKMLADKTLILVDNDYVYKKGEKPIKSFNNNGNLVCSNDIMTYIMLFDKFFQTKVPGVVKLKSYLSGMGKLFGKFNLPVPWKLPSGVMIQSGYRDTETIVYKPFKGERKSHSFRSVKEHFNILKMQNSLMPNFIHSLDGCAIALLYKYLMETLETCNNTAANLWEDKNHNLNLYTIHDCFGVTCDNADLLLESVREAYIELYFNHNYLTEFHATLMSSLIDHIGAKSYIAKTRQFVIATTSPTGKTEYSYYPVPDINQVLKFSKYFSSDILKNR